MVRAVILVKSPKKLIAARLRKITKIDESFPVSVQFDAVAVINVENLSEINKTMIIVSHRLSSLTICDKIYEINEGNLKQVK